MQLENYKIILEANSHLLEEDRLLNEHIHHKMWMIESRINEMNMAEKIKDQTKYHQELGEAARILDGLKQLIHQTLGDSDLNSDNGLPA